MKELIDAIEIEREDNTTTMRLDQGVVTAEVSFPTVFEGKVAEEIEDALDEQQQAVTDLLDRLKAGGDA